MHALQTPILISSSSRSCISKHAQASSYQGASMHGNNTAQKCKHALAPPPADRPGKSQLLPPACRHSSDSLTISSSQGAHATTSEL